MAEITRFFRIFAILIFVLFSTSTLVSSQSNFKEGLVITNEGDTLLGLINDREFFLNSQTCEFKDKQGGVQIFNPEDIKGYQFLSGKRYESKTITIQENELTVFCEVLFKGMLGIYFFQDSKRQNYFFASKDTLPLRELRYEKTMGRDESGRLMQRESRHFVSVLKYLTSDAPGMDKELERIKEPTSNSLVRFAKAYQKHFATEGDLDFFAKKRPFRIKFKADVGAGRYLKTPSFYPERIRIPKVGFSILTLSPLKSESFFVGFGIKFLQTPEDYPKAEDTFQLPISLNFIPQKNGISPFVHYEFDLYNFFYFQTLGLGLKYQSKRTTFFISAEFSSSLPNLLKSYIFVSGQVGVMFDLIKK